MSKTKVLILCHTPELYGATRSLLDVLQVLKEDKALHITVWVRTPGDAVQALQNMGVACKVVYFPLNVTFEPFLGNAAMLPALKRNWRRFKSYIQPYKAFRRQVREVGPDVIYTNTSIVYWGALYALFNRCRHVWHIRELKEQFNIKHHFGLGFLQWLMKRSHAVICNSAATAANYGITQNSNTHIVYNGLYTNQALQHLHNQWTKRDEGVYAIGMVAGINITKGQLEALKMLYEAAPTLNWVLYLVGGVGSDAEAYAQQIKQFVQQQHLQDKVVFAGKVADTSAYYQKLDMLISNSTAEAFGRVIVEAMAHGVVVLARASGGIPEIVTHGQNGWLFTNQEEFSQGFNWLVKNRNTDQLVWMKENAYATIQQKFSQEHYATVIRALLVA